MDDLLALCNLLIWNFDPTITVYSFKCAFLGTGNSPGIRVSCPKCKQHFCLDCDIYIHESLHNCPGCESFRRPKLLTSDEWTSTFGCNHVAPTESKFNLQSDRDSALSVMNFVPLFIKFQACLPMMVNSRLSLLPRSRLSCFSTAPKPTSKRSKACGFLTLDGIVEIG